MGILYIVATPIGNLKDITERALETLRQVDLIACEDTRQTIKLLNHYQIQKPLVSYFQHSKLSKIKYIAEQLASGKNVALVTDAGTPGISDPGGKLVEEVLRLLPSDEGRVGWGVEKETNTTPSQSPPQLRGRGEGVKIIPLPGPCAAIAALSISGFPADKFVFMGFPPHKKGRQKYFDEVVVAGHTVVFYESTHRILKTLEHLSTSLRGAERRSNPVDAATGRDRHASAEARDDGQGDRQIVVCRELTKMFESVYRGTAEEILNILKSDKNNQKGEFVVVVNKE